MTARVCVWVCLGLCRFGVRNVKNHCSLGSCQLNSFWCSQVNTGLFLPLLCPAGHEWADADHRVASSSGLCRQLVWKGEVSTAWCATGRGSAEGAVLDAFFGELSCTFVMFWQPQWNQWLFSDHIVDLTCLPFCPSVRDVNLLKRLHTQEINHVSMHSMTWPHHIYICEREHVLGRSQTCPTQLNLTQPPQPQLKNKANSLLNITKAMFVQQLQFCFINTVRRRAHVLVFWSPGGASSWECGTPTPQWETS